MSIIDDYKIIAQQQGFIFESIENEKTFMIPNDRMLNSKTFLLSKDEMVY